MIFKPVVLSGLLLLFLTPLQGEDMISNSGMELGEVGKGVPGYNVKMFSISRDELLKHPDRKHIAITTADGKDGKALLLPAYPGAEIMMIEPGDIKIDSDGEVELSLDARVGETVDGKASNVRFYIDFRMLGDGTVKSEKSWSHPNYPIITGMSGTPGKEWKRFTRRIKVMKWKNVYTTSLRVISADKNTPVNAPFYIDNFRIRFLDGKNEAPEEAAVIPDRLENYGFKGDRITFTVTALLRGDAGKTELVLEETSYPNARQIFPVTLKKDPAFVSQNGLLRYSGTLSVPAERYGLFRCILNRNGSALSTVGLFSVLHPPVAHKRFTPGWSIGMNSATLMPYNTPYSKRQETATLHNYNSAEQTGIFPKLAGIRNARIWGNWCLIEPEKGKFTSKIIDQEIDLYIRNGIEPFFCIAGGMGMAFQDYGPNGEQAKYPHYIHPTLRKLKREHLNQEVIALNELSLNDYKRYLNYCLETWGGKIRIWEQFNEPGVLYMDPNQYLAYMKYSYQAVKAKDRNFIFLGNGNTCDVGYDKGWCRRLTAADPNYTDFLDGVAFHPYYNATDYQDNIYNLYSKHIAELRASMKKQKPLYNTECFYIRNARKPQLEFYLQKGRCTAEAVQRHYLDGMLNDVRMASSPDNNAVVNHEPTGTGLRTFSEEGVALNALSAMLKDMETIEPVVLNPFMRAGIFLNAAKNHAMGFVYDLRASGSNIVGAETSGVKFYDLFGNPVKTDKQIPLSYEPLYLKGTPEQIKNFFRNVRFVPMKSCRVFGRRINDRIYLTAVNLTGQPGVMEVNFNKAHNLPSVRFEFTKDREDSTVDFPAVRNADYSGLPYSVHALDAELGGGTVSILPDSRDFSIPDKAEDAVELKLSRGSKIRVWNEGNDLCIAADVKSKSITPSPNDELWNGDALEVFVDPAPFSKPAANRIISTNPLNCFQYVFAATPSKTGKSILGISRTNPAFATKAVFHAKRTETGYALDIRIPWSEIRPEYNGVIGLELEVARPEEKGWKESLSGANKPAFAERRHYLLFQVKSSETLRNGNFAAVAYGDAANWFFSTQTKDSRIRCVPGAGYGNGNAVEFRTSKLLYSNWRQYISQEIKIPEWARRARISILAEMPECKLPNPQYYRWRPYGFFLTLGKSDMSYDRNMEFSKPFPWTLFQYEAPVQKGTRVLNFDTGLRQALGILKIAEIRIEFTK